MNAGQAHSADNTQEERGDMEKKIGNIGLNLEQTTCKYCCIYATTPPCTRKQESNVLQKKYRCKRQKMIERVSK